MPLFSLSNGLLQFIAIVLGGSYTVHTFAAQAFGIETERPSTNFAAGWVPLGCYSDSVSSRTLHSASLINVFGMTIESCLTFCTPGGYNFAGVESAVQCFCDNVIEPPGAPISASSCSMTCAGNATEICGGTGAINIFRTSTSVPAPPKAGIKKIVGTYNYVGCFADAVNGTANSLTNQTIVSGATAEACATSCKTGGFVLAGLESGGQCWCDNYMVRANVVPDSDCSTVCDGDQTELCGAANRLAVYQDTSRLAPGLQQCLTEAELHVPNPIFLPYAFTFAMTFSSGSNGSVPLALNSLSGDLTGRLFQLDGLPFTPTSSVTEQPFQFLFGKDVLFPEQVATQPQAGKPMPFQDIMSGVIEFQGYCAMPNPMSPFGSFIGPPVVGLSSDLVTGTSNIWSSCQSAPGPLVPIFNASSPANTNCTRVYLEMIPLGNLPPPPAATIKKTVGTFTYKGCFTDAVNGVARSLANQTITAGATAESCTTACKSAGFVLAGLESGGQCWCDNYMTRANPVPDSDCNSVCDGDPTELCGAGNRIAVYQDTGRPPLSIQSCLSDAQLRVPSDLYSYGFTFSMVYATGGATSVPLALSPLSDPFPIYGGESTRQFFQLDGLPFTPTTLTPKQPIHFSLDDFYVWPENVASQYNQPLEPELGEPMQFEATGIYVPQYQGYCAMPNPLSPYGTFIGPPVIGITTDLVTGQSNTWSSCQSTPGPLVPIFNASSQWNNFNCTNVYLAMLPI